MKFHLVDRITQLQSGKAIRTVKALSLAEEYLADHFPTYPVLPGVLMVEALVQSAAWLARATNDFAHSMVVLREARNVVYGNFVTPGSRMEIDVTVDEWLPDGVKVRGTGKVGAETAVKGRLTLRFYNLADTRREWAEIDGRIRETQRRHFALIGGTAAVSAAGT